MKKMITLVVMLALAMPTLMAQEGEENQADIKPRRNPGEVQTLFDPHSGSGGYGAFTIGYTQKSTSRMPSSLADAGNG
jgi:opacity protein-like surface antigen